MFDQLSAVFQRRELWKVLETAKYLAWNMAYVEREWALSDEEEVRLKVVWEKLKLMMEKMRENLATIQRDEDVEAVGDMPVREAEAKTEPPKEEEKVEKLEGDPEDS